MSRAAILTASAAPLSVEDVTMRPPGPHDVVVQVGASGVCHSDLSVLNGLVPVPPPMILGHEGAGAVVEVGPAVSRVQVGDRVIASISPTCGNCFFCLRDQSNLCEGLADVSGVPRAERADGTVAPGMAGLGTFASTMVVHETSVVPVATDLPDEQLALIGCGVTTGVGAALNTARVSPGATVAVFGCGGVGQSVIQGARIAGASRIIAVDPVELKRTTATSFGATDLVDPSDGDPVAQLRDLTDGRGVDFSFEVIGLPETMGQAYQAAVRGGTVTIVGMPAVDATVTFSAWQLFHDEKHLHGCYYGSARARRDLPRFVGLAETGRLDLGAMVTRTIDLDDVNDAMRAMTAGEVIRSVITF